MQFVNALAQLVLQKYRIDVADNRQARGVYTQVMVLKKIAVGAIAVFAIGSMLMVFQSVRQFGTAIIASAGVAGVVIGFAAQKSLAALLAGLQIAMTQPISIDDVVIVEGEWGKIEEITLTYVVVRIWDLRRLIVPITYFIEKPFQNWTRTSADILGTVFLQVDYGVPVDAVREELTRILDASPHWDRKVNVLQVTEVKERTLELRALASSSDAGNAWDLRCEVREKLVAFIRKNYPGSLPHLRATLELRCLALRPRWQVSQGDRDESSSSPRSLRCAYRRAARAEDRASDRCDSASLGDLRMRFGLVAISRSEPHQSSHADGP